MQEWIVNEIPRELKIAISAGIGMFPALTALHNAGGIVAILFPTRLYFAPLAGTVPTCAVILALLRVHDDARPVGS